jgi:DNA-binding NarL/FixJ family response regulator
MSDIESLRVLIVDDHPTFRLGLAASLQDMPGITVTGEGARAADVLELVATTKPDLVLLDLHLPDGSGLDVNRELAIEHPHVKVVFLTMVEDAHLALTALRDGARGYVGKSVDPARIEHVVRAVMAGMVVLDEEIAQAMAHLADLRRPQNVSPFPQLSPRELDILEEVAQGLDNPTIARRLYLNEKTVRNHVSNILAKLNARDRAELIVIARRRGLGGSTE